MELVHAILERAMTHGLRSVSKRGEDGAILAIVAIFTMVVLIGVAALVVDLGNGRQSRLQAQSAADATALAGATKYLPALISTGGMSASDWASVVSEVQTYMQTNYGVSPSVWTGCSDSAALAYTPDTANSDTCISSDASTFPEYLRVVVPPKALATYFGGVTGTNQLNISAAAVALVPTSSSCALCALSSGDNSDLGNGGITVSGGSGNVWVNSSLTCGGSNNGITAPGGVEVDGSVGKNCTSGTAGAGEIVDPLGGLPSAPPMTGLTSQSDCTGSTATAGLYNNIKNCVLAPGLYVVIGTMSGSISMAGGYPAGTGVTLFFTCGTKSGGSITVQTCAPNSTSGGQLTISGNSSFTATACSSGCTSDAVSGMAIWYDRNDANPVTLNGNGGLGVSGTIYASDSTLVLNGSPSTLSGTCSGVNLCSTVVVGSFNINGGSTISVNSGNGNSRVLGAPKLYQ